MPDRNLPQHQRHARSRLQQRERFAQSLVRLVDLVEEQKARNVEFFQLAQDELKLRYLFVVGLAHHDRRVDRRQDCAHIVDEFDGAGTVDECVVIAHEGGGGDRHLDAHFMLARFLAGVADRRARFNRALTLDRAGAGEYRLQQCGLAALKRAHQRDAAWTLRTGSVGTCAVLSHILSPLPAREFGPLSRPFERYRLRPGHGWQGRIPTTFGQCPSAKLRSTILCGSTLLSTSFCDLNQEI